MGKERRKGKKERKKEKKRKEQRDGEKKKRKASSYRNEIFKRKYFCLEEELIRALEDFAS